MTKTEARWRCRRSILELDILMSTFFDQCYDKLSKEDKLLFYSYLLLEDNELMSIIFHQPNSCKLLAQLSAFKLVIPE